MGAIWRTLNPGLWLMAATLAMSSGYALASEASVLAGADPAVVARIEEAHARTVAEPDDAGAWLELGKLYQAHELIEPALESYRRSTELAPAEPKAWYLMAIALTEIGEPERALATLDGVGDLVAGYAPAHWRRGRWLAEMGRTDEAEAAFRRSVDVDPAAAAGWVGIATILLERRELQEVVALLNPVLAADRTNGVAGQLLGRALMAAGDHDAGRRVLGMSAGMGAYFPDPWHEEVLTSATGVVNTLRLLSARLERGEVDRVARDLEALRAEHPLHLGLLNQLAEAHLRRGDIDSALSVLEAALTVDPAEFLTLVHLAQAHRFRGDLRAALTWADRALEANPRLWQGHFERAAILHRSGHLEECVSALESATRLGAHQNPNVWLMRGDAQIRLGVWPDAQRSFEQATDRFPFLGQAWVGLAVAHVEQGHLDDSRAALLTAGELQDEDGTMIKIRARIEELERAGGEPD